MAETSLSPGTIPLTDANSPCFWGNHKVHKPTKAPSSMREGILWVESQRQTPCDVPQPRHIVS